MSPPRYIHLLLLSHGSIPETSLAGSHHSPSGVLLAASASPSPMTYPTTVAPAMMIADTWAASLSVPPAATTSRDTKPQMDTHNFLLVSFLFQLMFFIILSSSTYRSA